MINVGAVTSDEKSSRVAVSSASPEPYVFPVRLDRKCEEYKTEEIIALIASMIKRAFHAPYNEGYLKFRTLYCHLNLELNYRQLIAPRFRPLNPLSKVLREPEMILASLDRQVIDLHWRAFSKDKPTVDIYNYEGLLQPNSFDFELAGKFAQEAWSAGAKAVHLHLTDRMQMEHAILASSEIKKKINLVLNGDVRGVLIKQRGAPQIESALRQSMLEKRTPEHIKHIPGLLDVWRARKLVGDSPSEIAKMIVAMTGNPALDPSSVRRKLKSLDRHLK